ncbi:RagB/SusD family nutrient uptake outer membrane protein [Hymenobacter lapidiphilus]|uniref:RagB/SusD family nutrient uptake outer membrane protein n=1 Tax=Hymenobacter lapidiphilus TaxID=2608003 RepID=A0A7Y7PMF1_9BACT|nr:RagB/SusD family nutrient uptake outer membrane protein [Hymenobacter lapidiphilus]NVO30521.1 RagB/SusD family nutrient uptake outer membrane protein [Hymenobacter lapidiphilus]
MQFSKYSVRLTMLGLLGLATSCEKTLDLKPANSLQADQVFVDAAGANAATIGAYGAFTSANYYGLRYPAFADLASDDVDHIGTFPTFAQIDGYNILPDNVDITNLWAALYVGVNRSNNVIAYAPPITAIPLATRRRLVAEARFVRAYNYFDLTRFWGAVPLSLTPTTAPDGSLNLARTPVADVYTQIKADLDSAVLYLPAQNTGRATIWSARALKARLSLYEKQWAEAERLADQVIASPLFALQPSYRSIYDNKNTSESIFEVQFDIQNQSQFAFFYFPQASGGRNEITPSPALRAAYETGDTRRPASISNGTFLVAGRAVPANVGIKYTDAGNGTDNFRAIRLAEMILTSAEAKAQQGKLAESLILLNRIRVRAGLPVRVALGQADLLTAIYQERRVELAMEGHRWFDLIRTGRAQQVLGVPDANRLLLPIPLRETINNPNIRQNPGY